MKQVFIYDMHVNFDMYEVLNVTTELDIQKELYKLLFTNLKIINNMMPTKSTLL